MDLSQVKMVVSDMDGTLLNSKHEVSDRFFKLFQELKKREIIFVAASGRQYNSMVEKLDAIRNDIIVVAENGAFIKKQDEELLTTLLPKNELSSVLKAIENIPGAHAALCSKHNAYVSGESEAFIQMLAQYYSNFEVVDLSQPLPAAILKVAIYHFESSEKYLYPALKGLEDQLKVKISGPNWIDVSSMNAHKGYAIEKLMKHYHIQPHEVLVFGDYNNDIEMLSLAKYSFAMANAHPNVLKTATYKTTSNDDFGVERILEKLLAT